MKINLIIIAGVALQLLASVILFADVCALTSNVLNSNLIPFRRWWIVFYNIGWSLGLLFIKWKGRSKKYKDWIMINTIYQFILNSGEISGLPSMNLVALYDAGLYILIIAEILIILHLYLPKEAFIKTKFISILEKVEFNVPSMSDFDGTAEPAETIEKTKEKESEEGDNEEDEEDVLPADPFGDAKKRAMEKAFAKSTPVKQEPELKQNEPLAAKEEIAGSKESFNIKDLDNMFEKIDFTVDQKEKDEVSDEISKHGDAGISYSELAKIFPAKPLLDILRLLEFEDRIIYSEKVENEVKYIYL
eukprot:NODE_39_length_35218_cov_0.479655.p14 type:complete len:304 gc:universal NODE_39_length_35218_cov_0.479655:31892-32803(+)